MKRYDNGAWISLVGAVCAVLIVIVPMAILSLTRVECILLGIIALSVFLTSLWLEHRNKVPYSMKIENGMLAIKTENHCYFFSKKSFSYLPLEKGEKVKIRGLQIELELDCNRGVIQFLKKFKES